MDGVTFTTLSESSTTLYNTLLLISGVLFAVIAFGAKAAGEILSDVKSALLVIGAFLLMVGAFAGAITVYTIDHNRAADSLVANLQEQYDVTVEAEPRDLLDALDAPLPILVTPAGSSQTFPAILTIDGNTATLASSTGTSAQEWTSPTK